MSRPLKSGGFSRSSSQSAGVAAAQAIAAQQMAMTQGFGVGGTSMGSSALSSTALRGTATGTASRLGSSGGSSSTLQTRPLSRTAPRRPAPRGSAAPADGGSTIDLSSFTGASGANFGQTGSIGVGGAGALDDTAAPAALENEYIVNLQQQVYFLELELNLMKKAGGGGGSLNPTGLRGSGAPSGDGGGSGGGFNDANVPDAPLDDVMLSLREKYVKMEAEYKKEHEDLRNENADLRSRARMRELEINNLKQLHTTLASESASWKAAAQDHQSTLLDHQLANEQMILKLTQRLGKREKKLEKVQEDLVHLRAEHKVTLANYEVERASYTEKWEERERKMDELNESYLAEKEKNLEWEQRFRQSNEAALMAQVQELQQTQLAMQSAVNKAELSREQAEKNKTAALESLDRIMGDNEQLRAAVQSMENEGRERALKESRDRASKSFWSSEVAHMQSQIVALTDKLNKVSAKYSDSKTLKKQLKDELVKSRVYLDELQSRLDEEQDGHNRTRASEEELNEVNREMKRDLTLKTEELQALMARFKEVKSESDAAAQARDQLHVQLTELQGKFDVTEALQQLKLHEFVSMAHSNLKVAGAIENLMGKMKKGENDTKGAQKRERHASRLRDEDLYSEASSTTGSSAHTPRHGGHRDRTERERERDRDRDRDRDRERDLLASSSSMDSRPTTQQSDMTNDTDSRPHTASSTLDSSFDGI